MKKQRWAGGEVGSGGVNWVNPFRMIENRRFEVYLKILSSVS